MWSFVTFRVRRPKWMRTGLGVDERSRLFRVDFDLDRLRELMDRDRDGLFDFFESILRWSPSFDFCLSFEPIQNGICYIFSNRIDYRILPLLLRADSLLLRFEVTLLSRRLSLLDVVEDVLELDDELEELLDLEPDDELLSEELVPQKYSNYQ